MKEYLVTYNYGGSAYDEDLNLVNPPKKAILPGENEAHVAEALYAVLRELERQGRRDLNGVPVTRPHIYNVELYTLPAEPEEVH